MTHVLTINESTCSRCGRPWAECTCRPVQNEYGYGDDDDDLDEDEGDEDEEDDFDEPEEDDEMIPTAETPMSHPQTWDFQPEAGLVNNQRKQRSPIRQTTVRQQYPLVANQGEERPLGQPTWAFGPADICPDEAEPVGNDSEERPMANRTWEF